MTQNQPSAFTAEETAIIRKRQAARSRFMGVALVGLCILFFLITVAKVGVWG
jgi:hypothetical protein